MFKVFFYDINKISFIPNLISSWDTFVYGTRCIIKKGCKRSHPIKKKPALWVLPSWTKGLGLGINQDFCDHPKISQLYCRFFSERFTHLLLTRAKVSRERSTNVLLVLNSGRYMMSIFHVSCLTLSKELYKACFLIHFGALSSVIIAFCRYFFWGG